MAGITQAQAEAKLTTWMDAEDAVATGQSYSIAGRSLTRADLDMIGERITFWNDQIKRLSRTSRTGMRVRGATPT